MMSSKTPQTVPDATTWSQKQQQCKDKHAENMLYNATLMTEMAMDLKERCAAGEKYVCYLRSLAVRAGRTVGAMQNTGKSFLLLAQKMLFSAIKTLDEKSTKQDTYEIKLEFDKLMNVLERELADIDDLEVADNFFYNDLKTVSLTSIREKIRYLEQKQKQTEGSSLYQSGSTKSVKSDVDEKYPDNCSRDSLIDLSNVVNLPTVPEDVFTGYSKPLRSSSLSSLKNLRKVKLFLQRAASTSEDDDQESDLDDHELARRPTPLTDSDEKSQKSVSSPKKFLGNIQEETPQE